MEIDLPYDPSSRRRAGRWGYVDVGGGFPQRFHTGSPLERDVDDLLTWCAEGNPIIHTRCGDTYETTMHVRLSDLAAHSELLDGPPWFGHYRLSLAEAIAVRSLLRPQWEALMEQLQRGVGLRDMGSYMARVSEVCIMTAALDAARAAA